MPIEAAGDPFTSCPGPYTQPPQPTSSSSSVFPKACQHTFTDRDLPLAPPQSGALNLLFRGMPHLELGKK
jgi:hypothetical protein